MFESLDRLASAVNQFRREGPPKGHRGRGGVRAWAWKRAVKRPNEAGGEGLDRACLRLREARGGDSASALEGSPWATISVQKTNRVGGLTNFVWIDGRRVGVLFGRKPKALRVRAGKHVVAVETGFWKKSNSLSVSIEPDQTIELVFERRPTWLRSLCNAMVLALIFLSAVLALNGLFLGPWRLAQLTRAAQPSIVRDPVLLLSIAAVLVGTCMVPVIWWLTPRDFWARPAIVAELRRKDVRKPTAGIHPLDV
jgi:hypothetical protein